MKPVTCLSTACLLAFLSSAWGEELRVGDNAPAVSITKWVKGSPVELDAMKEGGKVVVLEFWATWCGPCRTSIPHLTELQKKHAGDVVIVGVTRPDRSNPLEKVENFVEEWGDKMAYTVAFDGEGKTYEAYMRASGQRGIPTAFVIDKQGAVAWIGHPMRMDGPLEDIIAGTFDVELASIRTSLQSRLMRLLREQKIDAAHRALDAMAALDPDDPAPWRTKFSLHLRAEESKAAMAAAEQAVERASAAMDLIGLASILLAREELEGSQDLALKAARKAVSVEPKNSSAQLLLMRALLLSGATQEGLAAAKKLMDATRDDAQQLNSLAWSLLTDGEFDGSVLNIALQAAERCHELTEGKNWMYLDTLALAKFKTGARTEALELQRRAVELGKKGGASERMLQDAEERLAEFEKAVEPKPGVRL